MPIKDLVKRREYNRKWVKARRMKWVKARRMKWVKENGPCKLCGSKRKLEVDHVNRGDKKFNPRQLWSRNEKVRNEELNKCQVLCRKCHHKKTVKEFTTSECGSEAKYRRGCRCFDCTTVKVASVNEWRWRTGRRTKRE